MGLFDAFPISNAYSVNLDWILKKIKELEEFVRNWAAINEVRYAGVWDITKQYPRWALVADGDTTWLSNKPVPVGIPLENTEYWQKLADLDPRISGIIKNIAEIETTIAGINSDISGINSNIATINSDIANIKNLTLNRRMILIGDSYGLFPTGESWADKISKEFNVAKNVCENGSGFIGKNTGGTFVKELESCADVTNPETITDIVVVGGYNDMHYVLDGGEAWKLGGVIANFAVRAGQLFPNAKLHLGFAGWDGGGQFWTTNTPGTFNYVIPYYQEACRFGSKWSYIGGLEFVLHAPGNLGVDKYHPTGEGSAVLYNVIASHLIGGSNSGYLLPANITPLSITPSENVTNLELSKSNVKIVGNVGRVYMDFLKVTINTNLHIGAQAIIGTLENCPFQPVAGSDSVQYSVYVDGDTQQCALIITGRTLKFSPLSKAYTAGTAISINWTSWTEPLL